MNYCDKIHYNIYTTGLATFGEMVDALLAQLPQDEQILRLAFFGMPNDNEQYVSPVSYTHLTLPTNSRV